MSERVWLFRVADSAGHVYTEHPSEVLFALHDMLRGATQPREVTITPICVRSDEAAILIGEYYEAASGGREQA